jgi:hypothetical protein
VGPRGGAIAGGAQGFAGVGSRGTTVQGGRAGGVAVGSRGGAYADAASAARVSTAAGRSFTSSEYHHAAAGPYGAVYGHGGRAGWMSGPFGATAAGYRGGVAVGRYGARSVSTHTAVVGHSTHYVGASTLRARGASVRGGYYGRAFTGGWYGAHPAAWQPARWRGASYWAAPAWPAVASYCDIGAPPISYDYGSNVVINDNSVYQDGTQVASAADYAGQALAFADRGRQAQPGADEEWQSLGVFGLIQGDEQTADHIFQLAVNKAGVLRGNYYDALSDNGLPVYGSVDPTTQRAAWSVGDKKTLVFEAGLQNLTQDQATVLMHDGTDRTRQMALVRLEQPQEGQQEQGGAQ